MSDSFIDAYSALEARMKIVDVITNNLANANTIGFKRDFGHVLQGETGFDVGTQIDLSSGDLVGTSNDLDVAINGASASGEWSSPVPRLNQRPRSSRIVRYEQCVYTS